MQRDSAAAQFAAAMLDSESEAAWQAVETFFLKSDEAQYAKLHLGLLYLQQVPASPERAVAAFNDVVKWTSIEPDEYRRLRAVTLVAQAYAAAQAGEGVAERSYLEQLREEHLLDRDEEEELAEKTPLPLRSFWSRKLQDGGPPDGPRGRPGAGPPGGGRGGPPPERDRRGRR